MAAGASTTSTARGRSSGACGPSARIRARSTSSAPSTGSSGGRTTTGAGASAATATGAPELAGIGPSIPSQTAWALLGLFAAGVTGGPDRRARHRLPPARRRTPTARGWIRAGTARDSPACSSSSTTTMRSTSPSGLWACIGVPVHDETPLPLAPAPLRGARAQGRRPVSSTLGRFGTFLGEALLVLFTTPLKVGALPGPRPLHRLQVAAGHHPDRRLHGHGPGPAALSDPDSLRLRGVAGPGAGHLPPPRAGTGAVRPHGHGTGRLGPHRGDRHHAHHRADRRAHGDGPQPDALSGHALPPGRRVDLSPHHRHLQRRGHPGGPPGGRRAASGSPAGRTSAKCRPSWTWTTS